MFKINKKGTKTISLTSFWCLYVSFKHILPFSTVSIADFKHGFVSWISIPKFETIEQKNLDHYEYRMSSKLSHSILRWKTADTSFCLQYTVTIAYLNCIFLQCHMPQYFFKFNQFFYLNESEKVFIFLLQSLFCQSTINFCLETVPCNIWPKY